MTSALHENALQCNLASGGLANDDRNQHFVSRIVDTTWLKLIQVNIYSHNLVKFDPSKCLQ